MSTIDIVPWLLVTGYGLLVFPLIICLWFDIPFVRCVGISVAFSRQSGPHASFKRQRFTEFHAITVAEVSIAAIACAHSRISPQQKSLSAGPYPI